MRVEVKALSRHFTDERDWPFADKFIVCARHAFDAATIKPYLFVYLNKDRSHAAYVYGRTARHWEIGERTDTRYEGGVTQEFYFCPMRLVKFARITSEMAHELERAE